MSSITIKRDELLNKLEDANDIVDKISETQASIIRYQDDLDKLEAKAKKRAGRYALWGILYFVSGITGPFLTIIIAALLYRVFELDFGAEPWIIAFCGIFFGVALCGTIHALTLINYKKRCKRYFDKHSDPLLINLEAGVSKLSELWADPRVNAMESMIPEDYRSGEAISLLRKLINNQRADTLKEAINLFEDIQHKNRVESLQQQAVNTAREQIYIATAQTKIQQRVADNTERIAGSARYANILHTINTMRR